MTENGGPTMEELMATIAAMRQENEDARKEDREARMVLHAENAEVRRQAEEAQEALNAQAIMLRRLGGEADEEPPRDFQPFSLEVETETLPRHFLVPAMDAFTGSQDLVTHLKKFQAQMLISGGSDAIKCKVFIGTLGGVALDWFMGLPDRVITGFDVLSHLFVSQFAANKEMPLTTSDLFDVKQLAGESLRAYLNKFNGVVVKIRDPEEQMVMTAFARGLRASPFTKSLVRNAPTTMADIRMRATCHIGADEAMVKKREEERREGRPARTYQPRDFQRNVNIGSRRSDYTMRGDLDRRQSRPYDRMEKPIQFTPLNAPKAQILKQVNAAIISFRDADYEGVRPHEHDPIVVSAIMMSFNVKRILVDQGSSADVLFWDTFIGLDIPMDLLQLFNGVLVGFSGEEVEVREYGKLHTTFGANEFAKTILITYIVINCYSAYNMLLGRPSLNRLGAVVSSPHLKVKYPTDNGKVGVLFVDQDIAQKCYENSMRGRSHIPPTEVPKMKKTKGSYQVNLLDLDPRGDLLQY